MTAAEASASHPVRWRLSRAGIINVYQYEHEVLDFAGGRLLLRGVNGSGKSTAMNMLLPFLLTARPGRIDAAGEQVGILKSWMLADRPDPQPLGYLWIEYEQAGHHLTCGCGIKANRQSDTVATWWFVTERRPGIDLHLVEGGTALTADALRAQLDADEVYPDARRRDYRAEVERRLFGGMSIDQHIGLINVVRNPRVGDRIEVDLPEHLRNALPTLSEQALAEAAQPLDDLDDHRHNVAELAKTREAIDGLLAVYRAYSLHDLHSRLASAREAVAEARTTGRRLEAARRRLAIAAADVDRLQREVDRLRGAERTLRGEVAALRESPIYQEGQQLVGLRELLGSLERRVNDADRRLERATGATTHATRRVVVAQRRSRDDMAQLNQVLADVTGEATQLGLTDRGPGPVGIAERPIAGIDGAAPADPFETDVVDAAIRRVDSAASARQLDVDEVHRRRQAADATARALSAAERTLATAVDQARDTARSRDQALSALAEVRSTWRDDLAGWDARLGDQMIAAGITGPAWPVDPIVDGEEDLARGERLTAIDGIVEVLEGQLAATQSAVEEAAASEAVARELVEELSTRSEPDPPRLGWQADGGHCLGDLVDFAPGLDVAFHAPLEAALEASGLLSARLAAYDLVSVAVCDEAERLVGAVTVQRRRDDSTGHR